MYPAAALTPKERANRRLTLVVLLATVFFCLPVTAQVTLTLSPGQVTLGPTQTQDFTAVITGTTAKKVKFKVCAGSGEDCVEGGNSTLGTIAVIGRDSNDNPIARYTA